MWYNYLDFEKKMGEIGWLNGANFIFDSAKGDAFTVDE